MRFSPCRRHYHHHHGVEAERETHSVLAVILSILCGLSIARAEIQGAKFGSISYVMDTELETVMSPAEIGVDMGGAPSATFSCLAAS